MIHSLNFCSTRPTLVEAGSWNICLANCWVKVDPPPWVPKLTNALPKDRKSMPACS